MENIIFRESVIPYKSNTEEYKNLVKKINDYDRKMQRKGYFPLNNLNLIKNPSKDYKYEFKSLKFDKNALSSSNYKVKVDTSNYDGMIRYFLFNKISFRSRECVAELFLYSIGKGEKIEDSPLSEKIQKHIEEGKKLKKFDNLHVFYINEGKKKIKYKIFRC